MTSGLRIVAVVRPCSHQTDICDKNLLTFLRSDFSLLARHLLRLPMKLMVTLDTAYDCE